MIKLKQSEVNFIFKNSLDQNGKLFSWNGSLYRAISNKNANLYKYLLQNNEIKKLFDLGLIETEIAPVELEGFEMVLKHRKIPFINFPTEWSGLMLKDAALLTLNLTLELNKLGLDLQDAHPWNILFDGCRPIFIDFGSIVPFRKKISKSFYKEFAGTFTNPLILMEAGCPNEARNLIVNKKNLRGNQIKIKDILYVLLKKRKFKSLLKPVFFIERYRTNSKTKILKSLIKKISKIEIQLEKTKWSDYCKDEVDLSKKDEWIQKRKSVYESLIKCKPETLLDVGSNTGWFSLLAAMHNAKVVSVDNDDTCINKLYLNNEAKKLNILPLVIDFKKMSFSYGLDMRCTSALNRLNCEMVLAIALIHHLVFRQNLKFKEIIDNLSQLTNKWLLIEFIPTEDRYVKEWYNENFSWYSKDTFMEELKLYFKKIDEIPSNPEPRVMFLCEK